MLLRDKLSCCWNTIQDELFPRLEEKLEPLTRLHKQVVMVLDMARVEAFLPHWSGLPGRPPAERAALARAFVAKAALNLPTTRMLIDRVKMDKTLRRLCGWERAGDVPSESTFSRAFAEFASSTLPARVHEAVIKETHAERLVGHISRDSTAIEAREKSAPEGKPEQTAKTDKGRKKGKRGRRRKGEAQASPQQAEAEKRLIERQPQMSFEDMLADLPRQCDTGAERNAKGYRTSWTGYKLHMDVADGDIPVSCVLTSASLHDSQAAIPLAVMTAKRVTNLYDLMDAAYDGSEIREHSRSLGHVPIIDVNPRNNAALKQTLANEAKACRRLRFQTAEDVRYNERRGVERGNGNLKDNHGGRTVRVRGHAKVFCHLMFGILVLSVEQLMRFVT